jgi:hypothetical protein
MSAASTPAVTDSKSSVLIPPIIAIGGLAGHGKDTVAKNIADFAAEEDGIVYDWSKFATDLRTAMSIITGIPAERTISDRDKARELFELTELSSTPDKFHTRIGKAVEFVTEKTPAKETVAKIRSTIIDIEDIHTADGVKRMAYLKRMTVGRFLQCLGTDAFREHVGMDVWVNSYHRRRARGGNKPTITPDARFPNEVSSVKAAGGVTIYVNRPGYEGRKDGRSATHASENISMDFVQSFDFCIENDGTLEDLTQSVRKRWPMIKMLATTRRAEVI